MQIYAKENNVQECRHFFGAIRKHTGQPQLNNSRQRLLPWNQLKVICRENITQCINYVNPKQKAIQSCKKFLLFIIFKSYIEICDPTKKCGNE